MTVMNAYRNEFIDSLPTEKRKSAILSATFIAALCLILFLIKYTTPDPPPVAHLMVEDEILDAISVEDLLISDGGSAKGGGTPSNDERTEPMEQSEQLLTEKGNEPIVNGKSNHTVGIILTTRQVPQIKPITHSVMAAVEEEQEAEREASMVMVKEQEEKATGMGMDTEAGKKESETTTLYSQNITRMSI